jgi:hypothetical protein
LINGIKMGCWRYGRRVEDKKMEKLEISSASLRNWNVGMVEYAEWLAGDSLLSTICRISETS